LRIIYIYIIFIYIENKNLNIDSSSYPIIYVELTMRLMTYYNSR